MLTHLIYPMVSIVNGGVTHSEDINGHKAIGNKTAVKTHLLSLALLWSIRALIQLHKGTSITKKNTYIASV